MVAHAQNSSDTSPSRCAAVRFPASLARFFALIFLFFLFNPSPTLMNRVCMKGSVKRFGFSVGSRSPAPPHSPLVGRVVNLEGASSSDVSSTTWRLFGLRFLLEAGVLGRWGFLFLNQFGCVSPVGLTFMSRLAGQRWMEGKIDLSSSGTGPSIDHGAYSTLTEFILLKRNVKLLMLHFFGLEVP